MKQALVISLFVIGVITITTSQNANAEVIANNAYLVEGSGFAVTEKSIKDSQIDLLMSTAQKSGSSTPFMIDDGFITLDEMDYVVTDLTGTVLRDGRFLRISGTAENVLGNEISISVFGRLIQNTDEGSIYSFTGRLIAGSESNKIIYTSKISGLTSTSPTNETQTQSSMEEENTFTIRIAEGSANPDDFSYLEQTQIQQKNFFTPNRISATPGATLTFINDDIVSHSITSAKRDTNSRGAGTPEPDGRIASGEILPGQSWSVTIEDMGFTFLYDQDYPWMKMDVVVFPKTEQLVLGSTENPQN